MRSRLTDALASCGLCLLASRVRHYQSSRLHPSVAHASAFLPRLPISPVLLPRPPARLPACSGTMRALTSCRRHSAPRPLRLLRLAFGTSNPHPRDAARQSASVTLRSPVRARQAPGFALTPRARRNTPPNRFVILQAVPSPPVALHPASRRRSYLRLHARDFTWHRLSLC